MPPTGRPNESRIDPIEVRDELIKIKRGLELQGPNVIVTHRIRASAETPVEFQVIDPLPASLDLEEVGFDPNNEPLHGRIDDQAATISGVIEPGEESVIRYGLRPTESRPPEDIERVQQSARPSVEISSPVDRDGDSPAYLEKATMTRSASQAKPTDAESMAAGSATDGPSPSEDGPDETAAASDDDSPDKDHMIFPGRGDAAAGDGDEVERASEPPAAEAERQAGESEAAAGEAPPSLDARGGTTPESEPATAADREDRQAGGVFGVDEGAPPEGEAEPTERSSATEVGDETPAEDDVVEALIQQFERGDFSPDQRQRLAEQLDDVLAVTRGASKSTELRLRQVESEVQAMSTYTEALEGIIDEFGPADEFLAEVRREVEGLDSSVEQIQDDLERAASSRAGLGDRLDNLSDEFAILESRLERVDDRVEALRSVHQRKVSTLEGKVEELGDLADRVADLEPELASLREAVQEGRARRRAIARALSEDEPPPE